jgi:hypothetical protein
MEVSDGLLREVVETLPQRTAVGADAGRTVGNDV